MCVECNRIITTDYITMCCNQLRLKRPGMYSSIRIDPGSLCSFKFFPYQIQLAVCANNADKKNKGEKKERKKQRKDEKKRELLRL